MKEQFNNEKYNRLVSEGKTPKVVTRDGRSARIICTDKKGNFPVVAAILESDNVENLRVYMDNGVYSDLEGLKSPYDLFFADLEQTYRPYKDAKEFLEAQKEHGLYLYLKSACVYKIVTGINRDSITILWDSRQVEEIPYSDLMKRATWVDGSVCGVKEE